MWKSPKRIEWCPLTFRGERLHHPVFKEAFECPLPETVESLMSPEKKEIREKGGDVMGFPGGASGREPACHAGEVRTYVGDVRDAGSFSGSRRSSGGGHGNPLQYSCLENPMDWGAWQATVHGVAQNWTRRKWLSMHACRKSRGIWLDHFLSVNTSFLISKLGVVILNRVN